jgi:hypothetical protein
MRKLFLGAALLAAMLVPVSAASAAPHNPTGEYAVFSDCPLSNPNLFLCIHSEATSGSFTMGKKTVPIVNPVVLQGGLEENGETFYGAEDGNTLSKSPQPVPGGLAGVQIPASWPLFLRELWKNTLESGPTGVNATVELAGPASSVDFEFNNLLLGLDGTAVSMPVKIKLENPLLGNNCYVGSNASPVVLNFTTGTTSPPPPNQPLAGDPGEFFVNPAGDILASKGNSLVDNSFAAPAAKGCGGLLSLLIDPVVNSMVGLPSPAGTNTAILNGDTISAVATSVRASEP